VQPILSQKEKEQRAKKWESSLQKARTIYQQAVHYAERSGTLKTKPKAPRVSFSPKALVITYHDPDKDIKQEFLLTRNTVLASICEKVYADCRQKGTSLSAKDLYEYLKKYQPRCYGWDSYEGDPLGSRKRLYDNVDSVNRWSEKSFDQRLLRCDKEKVTRLL
jgi:hypothetical protein